MEPVSASERPEGPEGPDTSGVPDAEERLIVVGAVGVLLFFCQPKMEISWIHMG